METVPKQAATEKICERIKLSRRIHRGQGRNNCAEDEFGSDEKATIVHQERALGICPFEFDEITFDNVVDACQTYFAAHIDKDMFRDILAGERGPPCIEDVPNSRPQSVLRAFHVSTYVPGSQILVEFERDKFPGPDPRVLLLLSRHFRTHPLLDYFVFGLYGFPSRPLSFRRSFLSLLVLELSLELEVLKHA